MSLFKRFRLRYTFWNGKPFNFCTSLKIYDFFKFFDHVISSTENAAKSDGSGPGGEPRPSPKRYY